MYLLNDEGLRELAVELKTHVLDPAVGAGFDDDEAVRLGIARNLVVLIKQTQIDAFARSLDGSLQCDADAQVLIATNFYSPALKEQMEAKEEGTRAEWLEDEDFIEDEEAEPGG